MAATATLEADGSAILSLDGTDHKIGGTSVETTRQRIRELVTEYAAKTGQPQTLEAHDSTGSWQTIIHPDGRIEAASTPAGTPPIQESRDDLDEDPGQKDAFPEKPAISPSRRGRRMILAAVAAAVLLAGAAATTAVVSQRQAPAFSPTGSTAAPQLWQITSAPREISRAADGVLVTAGAGKVEVFSLEDGKALGGGVLPEGRVRVFSGTGAVFAVVTGSDGTNAGYVAGPDGVKDFKAVKGTLVTRGTEPFLLTGTGKDQSALVWNGTGWKPVTAPEPGMAPVAASMAGVLWLGTNGRLIQGASSAPLQTPETATKISAWVWADETSLALVWDTPKGQILTVHTIVDGKITGQVPVPDGEVRKDGNVLHAGTQAYTILSGKPVAAACADPVPAGGRLWCNTDKTWAAESARPLAPGQTPVPSPEDVVITATDTGFTAYPGNAKNDNN